MRCSAIAALAPQAGLIMERCTLRQNEFPKQNAHLNVAEFPDAHRPNLEDCFSHRNSHLRQCNHLLRCDEPQSQSHFQTHDQSCCPAERAKYFLLSIKTLIQQLDNKSSGIGVANIIVCSFACCCCICSFHGSRGFAGFHC
jgi:hypothetical protein